jgi:hypothetical protein
MKILGRAAALLGPHIAPPLPLKKIEIKILEKDNLIIP